MQIIRIQDDKALQEAFRIRIEVFVEEQQVPADLEMDEYDESPAAAQHVLLQIDGEPAAAGRFIAYKENTAKMQRIAVRRKFRGQAVGKNLMAALEEWASEQGFTYSLLDAQVQAEPFYQKLGYEAVSSETFLDAGIPHVRMKKNLLKSR